MITVRAVFFTGIAGSACFQHKRIFTIDYLVPFYSGSGIVYGYILAFCEASYRFALCAFVFVELKLRHNTSNLPPKFA
jgi:hypothetical protein